jgi:hypothetical protein
MQNFVHKNYRTSIHILNSLALICLILQKKVYDVIETKGSSPSTHKLTTSKGFPETI